MFKRLVPAFLLVAAMSAVPAHAAMSYYVGNAAEAAFNTDLLSAGLTASGIINYGTQAGFVGPSLTLSDTGFSGAANMTVTGTELVNGVSSQFFITPGATTYAIGLHIRTTSSAAATCFVDCVAMMNLNTNPQFFGIISTSPISTFNMQPFGGVNLAITDFQLGTQGATGGSGGGGEVPEPSTMALMGGALITFPLLVQRKKRAQ